MESTYEGNEQKLSLLNKLAYGCSDMGNNIVFVVVTTYLMFYYTDILKLNLASVGLLFLIVRIADIFAGPVVGILVDRTTSKFGKARPWFLWMSIPYGLAAILTFSIGYFPSTMHLFLAIYQLSKLSARFIIKLATQPKW
ncbi:MFS transporter [Levilactobacillus brevis]|uniref:MFS transporter n=1 Tax=Levilactobacillus brevis TaxID=1580 RepID=UPI00374E759E